MRFGAFASGTSWRLDVIELAASSLVARNTLKGWFFGLNYRLVKMIISEWRQVVTMNTVSLTFLVPLPSENNP